MENTKSCRECGRVKPLSDFYKHKKMADGHLNKCKSCVKLRVSRHRSENIERIRDYDKARGNLPHRVKARKLYAQTEQGKAAGNKAKKAFSLRYPKKRRSSTMVGNALRMGRITKQPCEVCGSRDSVQGHHDDYDKPLSVRWLCPKHHSEWHRHNEAVNGA